jgi:hypothetical protein
VQKYIEHGESRDWRRRSSDRDERGGRQEIVIFVQQLKGEHNNVKLGNENYEELSSGGLNQTETGLQLPHHPLPPHCSQISHTPTAW